MNRSELYEGCGCGKNKPQTVKTTKTRPPIKK